MLGLMATDVVIVGGGVIGLSIAYRLAQEGVKSILIDRGPPGREASWAGAGMIPANTTRLRGQPMSELRSWSAALYPEWSDRLREETGIDNGYRRTGGVDVAFTEAEERDLRSMAGRWKLEGITYERLAPSDFGRVEPALSPALRVAYFLPDRAQMRNPWHLRALIAAATNRGVRILAEEPVLGFETDQARVIAVRTERQVIPCDTVIVSAGAWTGALLEGLGVDAPTRPWRGQMVLLKAARPLLRRIVEHGDHYLVPREDGHVLVGSTEEDVGFDRRPTRSGAGELLAESVRLCPILSEASAVMTWAGLRPGSVDTRPYIGPAPGFANAFVASGHKRAGLQLSPATAEVMTDLVLARPPRIDLDAFRLDREPATTADRTFRS
jgi:glycine oxidase